MKTKHTPGPWKVEKEGFNVWNEKDRIAFTGTERINSMGGVSAFPVDERKANAKLIAAAPELLESCIEAESTIEMLLEEINRLNPSASMSLALIKKAIKKATE